MFTLEDFASTKRDIHKYYQIVLLNLHPEPSPEPNPNPNLNLTLTLTLTLTLSPTLALTLTLTRYYQIVRAETDAELLSPVFPED